MGYIPYPRESYIYLPNLPACPLGLGQYYRERWAKVNDLIRATVLEYRADKNLSQNRKMPGFWPPQLHGSGLHGLHGSGLHDLHERNRPPRIRPPRIRRMPYSKVACCPQLFPQE